MIYHSRHAVSDKISQERKPRFIAHSISLSVKNEMSGSLNFHDVAMMEVKIPIVSFRVFTDLINPATS